jgi:hypothetical protein
MKAERKSGRLKGRRLGGGGGGGVGNYAGGGGGGGCNCEARGKEELGGELEEGCRHLERVDARVGEERSS